MIIFNGRNSKPCPIINSHALTRVEEPEFDHDVLLNNFDIFEIKVLQMFGGVDLGF